MTQQIPVVDYLVLDAGPQPAHLRAWECGGCGARYLERRNACARCSGVEFARTDLAAEGTLRAFTRVVRGAKRPFTSVVVDLDGGGTVKANLHADCAPEAIPPGLRVRLITFVAGTDDDGVEAVAFGFEPISEVSA